MKMTSKCLPYNVNFSDRLLFKAIQATARTTTVKRPVDKKNKLASFQTLLRLSWNPLNLSYMSDFSRIESNSFEKTLSRFKKRKDKSSSYIHVLHKTTHYERFHVVESCGGRQINVLKRVIHVQSQCCFAHKTNCLFFDVVIVVVAVA